MSHFGFFTVSATLLLAAWDGGCGTNTLTDTHATGAAGNVGAAGSSAAGGQPSDAGPDDSCCSWPLGTASCSVDAKSIFICVVGGPSDTCPGMAQGQVWRATECANGCTSGAAGAGGAAGMSGDHCRPLDAGNGPDDSCCSSLLGTTSCSIDGRHIFTCVVGGPSDTCPGMAQGQVWQATECANFCNQGGAAGASGGSPSRCE